jgi:hypothetical protein
LCKGPCYTDRVDEEPYLNELVVYRLHFESYKYDQVTGKLVEVPINVFQKISPMQAIIVVISSQNEFVVNINGEPQPIRRGTKMAIISYTLHFPTKPVEVPTIIVNI